MDDNDKSEPKAKMAESRRQRPWELRCQGKSYSAIALAIGCSVSTAHKLVHRTEDEANALLNDTAMQMKAEHLGQLELVKERAFASYLATGKAPYANAILKTIELERKVLGLDREAKADDGKLAAEDLLRELSRELDG